MVSLYDIVPNIEIALSLFYLVWLFSWAKGALGSAKLAIFFAVIVVFLTVWQFPILIWLGVLLFLFSTFGKELFAKVAKA
jgi:hypothetical protein